MRIETNVNGSHITLYRSESEVYWTVPVWEVSVVRDKNDLHERMFPTIIEHYGSAEAAWDAFRGHQVIAARAADPMISEDDRHAHTVHCATKTVTTSDGIWDTTSVEFACQDDCHHISYSFADYNEGICSECGEAY